MGFCMDFMSTSTGELVGEAQRKLREARERERQKEKEKIYIFFYERRERSLIKYYYYFLNSCAL